MKGQKCRKCKEFKNKVGTKYLQNSLYSQAQIIMTFSVDYAHADTPTHINSFIRTYPAVYRSDRDDMGSKYCLKKIISQHKTSYFIKFILKQCHFHTKHKYNKSTHFFETNMGFKSHNPYIMHL